MTDPSDELTARQRADQELAQILSLRRRRHDLWTQRLALTQANAALHLAHAAAMKELTDLPEAIRMWAAPLFDFQLADASQSLARAIDTAQALGTDIHSTASDLDAVLAVLNDRLILANRAVTDSQANADRKQQALADLNQKAPEPADQP